MHINSSFCRRHYRLQIVKENLAKFCKLKDLGTIQRCLSINVNVDRNRGIIELDQSDYVSSLLKTFGMDECNSTSTLMDRNSLNLSDSPSKTNTAEDIPY